MEIETAAIYIGQEPEPNTGAVIPPIYSTSTFSQIEPGVTNGYDYTRSGNPNFSNLEKTLSAIEEAEYATVFGSGMAAITAILSSLKHGDLILAEENIYGCTYRILDRVFNKFGLSVEYLDFSNSDNFHFITEKSPALVWIESPTNPLLKIIDIEAVSRIVQKTGSTLVVDNTFASAYLQKPIKLGACISVSSTTKYINGHSDSLGGVVITDQEDWHEKMIFAQKAVGLNPSPFDTWLISRGVKTLPVRMEQHCKNAQRFANFLESLSVVKTVRYPFLKSHVQYELAKRQMTGGSGIVTVTFDFSLEQTKKLISGLKYFTLAESLGGIESLVCHPASMTHASIPQQEREYVGISDGLVRFSVGIENCDDLIDDFNNALTGI